MTMSYVQCGKWQEAGGCKLWAGASSFIISNLLDGLNQDICLYLLKAAHP